MPDDIGSAAPSLCAMTPSTAPATVPAAVATTRVMVSTTVLAFSPTVWAFSLTVWAFSLTVAPRFDAFSRMFATTRFACLGALFKAARPFVAAAFRRFTTDGLPLPFAADLPAGRALLFIFFDFAAGAFRAADACLPFARAGFAFP